jgi:hypothetical protein
MSEICLRTINLRAAVKNNAIKAPERILASTLELDDDLDAWRDGLPAEWAVTAVATMAEHRDTNFPRESHSYINNFVADAWNNWRALKILVRLIVLECEESSGQLEPTVRTDFLSIIQAMSVDICNSMSFFKDRSREQHQPHPMSHC